MASSETLRGDGAHSPSSPVDLAKVRVGDEVLVRGTILHLPDKSGDVQIDVSVDASRFGMFAPAGAIVSHTPTPPKALEVGEAVRDGALAGSLLAIHFMRGWVEYSNGNYGSPLLSDLERVS